MKLVTHAQDHMVDGISLGVVRLKRHPRADILAMADRVFDGADEALDVSLALVEALTAKWVDGMRGVSDEGDALADVAIGVTKAQGEGRNGPFLDTRDDLGNAVLVELRMLESPVELVYLAGGLAVHVLQVDGAETEASVDEGDKVGGSKTLEPRCVFDRRRPYHRREVSGEGKHGEWASGQEALIRGLHAVAAIAVIFNLESSNYAVPLVGPASARDVREGSHGAVGPIGAN